MQPIYRREALTASASLALGGMICSGALANNVAPDPYEDAVLVDGEPDSLQPGSFSIAVLPDTQNYSEKHPQTYLAQTKWLVENQGARNIAFVLHLGDITNRNTPEQWKNAQRAMRLLDGKLSYAMVPGNHDYSQQGKCSDRTTLLNDYFPVASFKQQSTFGGTYDKEADRAENSYHLFSAEGRDFLVLALEFGPRRDVVRWANEIAERFKEREAILITHAYMYYDDTRYDWQKYAGAQSWNPHNYGLAKPDDDVTDGEELWQQLVSQHDNFIMTLNGHVLRDGLGRLHSVKDSGRGIDQLLVNFQMRPNGGDGWLRLLEFRPNKGPVQVYDYSPTRNQHNRSPQNQFTLPS
jgi:predicted phosphodiesterase